MMLMANRSSMPYRTRDRAPCVRAQNCTSAAATLRSIVVGLSVAPAQFFAAIRGDRVERGDHDANPAMRPSPSSSSPSASANSAAGDARFSPRARALPAPHRAARSAAATGPHVAASGPLLDGRARGSPVAGAGAGAGAGAIEGATSAARRSRRTGRHDNRRISCPPALAAAAAAAAPAAATTAVSAARLHRPPPQPPHQPTPHQPPRRRSRSHHSRPDSSPY